MSYARSLRKRRQSGISLGPTIGESSPKNSRRGCLCLHNNTYHVDCCDGYLQNQGIGQTEVSITLGAFSSGFSNGFDIQETR